MAQLFGEGANQGRDDRERTDRGHTDRPDRGGHHSRE
jgi:hypothetical protein